MPSYSSSILAHWDIDALSVRNELTHWICGHCKHFIGLPLEPGMVRYDSLRSIRSKKPADAQPKDKSTTKKDRKSKGKGKDKGKNPATETAPLPPTNQSQNSINAKSAATEEPEAIQDLEGLRRQQLLRMQRAEEKRRQYGQGALESSGGANDSNADMQPLPPPQPIVNGVNASKDSLDPMTIPKPSLGISLEELTLRLQKEIESGESTLALAQAPIQDSAEAVSEPSTTSSTEVLATVEVVGDANVQAQSVIALDDPVVQDVTPAVERSEPVTVLVEATGKVTSAAPETTISSARTSPDEDEEVVSAVESALHMGHPQPNQSMIVV